MIVKGLKQSAGKQPAGKNPILGDFEKTFRSGSGSKKKIGSGRVAGTRQGLLENRIWRDHVFNYGP